MCGIPALLRIGLLLAVAQPCFGQGDPLFLSDEPLSVTFEMPVETIEKQAEDRPIVDGVMHYKAPDGSSASIDMTMTTRGRSRLNYCFFPPLKVNLKRGQTKDTLFAGQNKLKIVTHCRKGDTHLRYLQQEFGIYKAYNLLSDFSFRVRWIDVTYKDSEGKEKDLNTKAFFIESSREVAERHGRVRATQNRIPPPYLDPVESSKYALFQYLIANTDWSMVKGPGDEGCCHNGKVLLVPDTTENWVVLAYDFDQAGLISTRYAAPSEALRIRSVRQRLYRGRCRHNPQLEGSIALFNEKRAGMEQYLVPGTMSNGMQKKARKFVGAFYEIVNSPSDREKKLYDACIGS